MTKKIKITSGKRKIYKEVVNILDTIDNILKEGKETDYDVGKKNGLYINGAGTKKYYSHGLLHRIDGPAIEYINGTKEWYQNGELHRIDGPAIEGGDTVEWYVHGVRAGFIKITILKGIKLIFG
jgi:hypothetical protein